MDEREPLDKSEYSSNRKKAGKQSLTQSLISWGKTIGVALVLAFLIRNFLIVNASVVSGSMEDTIMTGDRVICNRLAYLAGEPARYDVVAFDYTEQGAQSKVLVKRVIGLPGETVEISEGKVYIDGSDTPLNDDYVNGVPTGDYGPFTVPEGCYFMLGDNRDASYDSKNWPDPYVPKSQILGKALFCYFPSIKGIDGPRL